MTRETDDLRERLIQDVASMQLAWMAFPGNPTKGGGVGWPTPQSAAFVVDAVLSALPRLTEAECETCRGLGRTGPLPCVDCDGDGVVEQAGAILPERVTDEMVERACDAFSEMDGYLAKEMPMRAALEAALSDRWATANWGIDGPRNPATGQTPERP